MNALSSVNSICEAGLQNLPGVRKLEIVATSDFNDFGQIVPGATVYSIVFSTGTGSFTEDTQSGQSGDFYNRTAQVFIPRYRFATTKIVRTLKDRSCIVKVTDNNDDVHIIHNAKLKSRQGTGSKGGDRSGYEWTLTGQTAGKAFYNFSEIAVFTGGDGYLPGDLSTPSFVPNPTTPGGVEACCVTILTTPILFTPAAEGNSMHHNKIVTVAATGDVYFIDKFGYSKKLSTGTVIKERINGTGAAVYNLTQIMDAKNTIVNRTQNVLKIEDSDPVVGIQNYNIVDGVLKLDPEWPLESGEWIEVYKLAG